MDIKTATTADATTTTTTTTSDSTTSDTTATTTAAANTSGDLSKLIEMIEINDKSNAKYISDETLEEILDGLTLGNKTIINAIIIISSS